MKIRGYDTECGCCLGALVLLSSGAAMAQAPEFSSDVQFDTGGTAVALAIADFNRDLILDAAVANNEETVTILISVDGQFEAMIPSPLEFSPTDIVAADFNGDGNTDVAVIGFDEQISILFGDGAGELGPPVATGQPEFVFGSFMRTADMDADGDVDIVLSLPSVVLLNDGAGGFGDSVSYPGNPVGTRHAIGDLDGNGFPDIVTTDFDDGVDVALNMGGGEFVAGPSLPAGEDVVFALVADIDDDGLNDIVASNSVGGFEPAGVTGTVAILRNLGRSNFAAAEFVEVGDDPADIVAGDVNGDGLLDLVVGNRASGTVSVLTSRTDGTFRSDVMFGNDPGTLALVDVDQNDKLDIVMTSGGLGVLFNRTAPADLDDDGVVGTTDLLILLSNWGPVDP